MDCDGESLQVRVRDGSPVLPRASSGRASRTRAAGGWLWWRGLSSDWGVDPEPDGKHVWFVMREPTVR